MAGRSRWRDAGNKPSVPIFPGIGVTPVAFLPLGIWAFHWTKTNFYIALGTMVVCAIMSKAGLGLDRTIALIQHKLRGNRIYARPWWYRNHFAPPGRNVGLRHSGFSYESDDPQRSRTSASE